MQAVNETQFVVDPKHSIPNILGFVDFGIVQLALTPSHGGAGFAEMLPGSLRDGRQDASDILVGTGTSNSLGNRATYCNLSLRWRSLTLW